MLAFEQRVVLNSIRNMGMRKKRKGRIFYTRKKKRQQWKKNKNEALIPIFPLPRSATDRIPEAGPASVINRRRRPFSSNKNHSDIAATTCTQRGPWNFAN